jgi:hypothetical protein
LVIDWTTTGWQEPTETPPITVVTVGRREASGMGVEYNGGQAGRRANRRIGGSADRRIGGSADRRIGGSADRRIGGECCPGYEFVNPIFP